MIAAGGGGQDTVEYLAGAVLSKAFAGTITYPLQVYRPASWPLPHHTLFSLGSAWPGGAVAASAFSDGAKVRLVMGGVPGYFAVRLEAKGSLGGVHDRAMHARMRWAARRLRPVLLQAQWAWRVSARPWCILDPVRACCEALRMAHGRLGLSCEAWRCRVMPATCATFLAYEHSHNMYQRWFVA
jgi:hypothetical protein